MEDRLLWRPLQILTLGANPGCRLSVATAWGSGAGRLGGVRSERPTARQCLHSSTPPRSTRRRGPPASRGKLKLSEWVQWPCQRRALPRRGRGPADRAGGTRRIDVGAAQGCQRAHVLNQALGRRPLAGRSWRRPWPGDGERLSRVTASGLARPRQADSRLGHFPSVSHHGPTHEKAA